FVGGVGDDTITIGVTTKAIVTGAGNDTVTSTGVVGTGGSVDFGDGTLDTIVLTGAQADAADATSTFNSKFTNFEVLSLATGATETLDMVGLGNVSLVTTIGANGLTLSNFVTSGTFTLTGPSTKATVVVRDAAFNATDTLNVTLSNSSADTDIFGEVVAANVETINISMVDAGTGTSVPATIDTATLTAVNATKVVVSGNNGLTLANTTSVNVLSFDASGVVADSGAFDTAANLAVTYVSAATSTTKAVTIVGGAGDDVLTGNTAVVHSSSSITGGEGKDKITGSKGVDTINLAETTAAADTVIFAVTANNGIDTIAGFAAGSGADIAQVVAASTTAGTTGGNTAVFGTSTNTTLTTGAQAFALTGASTNTDDVIEINATLSSFGDLGKAGVVDGAELLKALSANNTAAASITSAGNDEDAYLVAYQNGNAYLYEVANGGTNTAIVAAEIFLVGVFTGVAQGAFVSGDFTV
ncbi:MAG: S-layer protein, partial [Pseudohongiellaceae bacterium]